MTPAERKRLLRYALQCVIRTQRSEGTTGMGIETLANTLQSKFQLDHGFRGVIPEGTNAWYVFKQNIRTELETMPGFNNFLLEN